MSKKVFKSKMAVLSYYFKNSFVSHETALFVYGQLKNFYDIEMMIEKCKLNKTMKMCLEKDIEKLMKEFKEWK